MTNRTMREVARRLDARLRAASQDPWWWLWLAGSLTVQAWAFTPLLSWARWLYAPLIAACLSFAVTLRVTGR